MHQSINQSINQSMFLFLIYLVVFIALFLFIFILLRLYFVLCLFVNSANVSHCDIVLTMPLETVQKSYDAFSGGWGGQSVLHIRCNRICEDVIIRLYPGGG